MCACLCVCEGVCVYVCVRVCVCALRNLLSVGEMQGVSRELQELNVSDEVSCELLFC